MNSCESHLLVMLVALLGAACSADPAFSSEMLSEDDDEPALGCFAFGPCDGVRDSSTSASGDAGVEAGADGGRDAELADADTDAGDAAQGELDAAVDSGVVGPDEVNDCGGRGPLTCECGGPCIEGEPCAVLNNDEVESFWEAGCPGACEASVYCNPSFPLGCDMQSSPFTWQCEAGLDGQWMTRMVCRGYANKTCELPDAG